MKFKDIPQFIECDNYHVNISMEYLVQRIAEWENELGLQLNPDFQRGHVWTEEQQIAFIEFVLKGGKSGRDLYFNMAGWMTDFEGDFVCVDGLQRITAIQRFLNNEIKVFGQYYKDFGERTDRVRHNMCIHVNTLKTKREVLQWYIEMNAGGTPHSKEEIERVRKLMEQE